MLNADWNYKNQTTWQPGKTIEIIKMAYGYGAKFFVYGTPTQTDFPYENVTEAKYAAEKSALAMWGKHQKG